MIQEQHPAQRFSGLGKAARGSPGLRKELNLFDVTAIVVGTIIGSGIFLIPNFIAAQLLSFRAVMLVWTVGGILTVCGALSLAELGSMYPGTGGLCSYLQNAYGRLPAFLYAWGLLFMIHSGTVAGLAVAFGLYLGQVLSLRGGEIRAISVLCILSLTTINCFGIRGGKRIQNLIAIAKVLGLAGIIILLLAKGTVPIHFFEGAVIVDPSFRLAGFGMALVAVLWAYEAWHVVSFVAGEIKDPQRNLPRGLFLGTAIVMLIYMLANLGYYHVLRPTEIRQSSAVAASAVGTVLGPVAAGSISILILISILGSMNGMILTGPRVYYAMAREGIFPRVFARIDTHYRTPLLALMIQGVWASVLAGSHSYQQIFTDVIFTAWIFYGLAVAAVMVLRVKKPNIERPYRSPGYPWISLLFCAAAIGIVANTFLTQPKEGLTGIILIAVGVPIYFFLIKPASTQNRVVAGTGDATVETDFPLGSTITEIPAPGTARSCVAAAKRRAESP